MNSHGVSGKAESYWIDGTPGTAYPAIQQEIMVDVAIIGGGIAGIMSAIFLKESGLTVAIIEAKNIVKGVTGYTTAKITSLHRLIYHDLASRFGQEKARQYADSNQAAIDRIESIARERNIDCDFSRQPFYTYALTEESLRQVEDEVKAAQSLGLPASFVSEIPLPFPIRGAIRFDNQAQFHPRKFLLGLASSITGEGSFIFENSRVTDVEEGKICTIISEKGQIRARNVIVATNYPIWDKKGLYFARLYPGRSYALGIRIREQFPGGMYIDADESGYAWRSQPEAEGELAIVSGRNHPTGQGDAREQYQKLKEYADKNYDRASVEYSWSTQDSSTADRASYIGLLNPVGENIFVATGFAKWGMTTSVAAGMILTDMILGRSNPWADVYNPNRFHADSSTIKKLISKNANVVKMFVTEHLTGLPDISQLGEGEGGVVEANGKRLAVYKDMDGKVYKLSPNCKHMGCTVHWNNAEKTWDCPCHGSRYSFTGDVIQSPTIEEMDKVED